MTAVGVILEVGKKRVFASATDWPGWCRSGRDRDSAIAALIEYAPRYRECVSTRMFALKGPFEASIEEELEGDASTEFGAPGAIPEADRRPATAAELDRLMDLLDACMTAFDRAAAAGEKVTLRLGPRGGGRDARKMREHVSEAHLMYLARLGSAGRQLQSAAAVQRAFREAAHARERGEIPELGPRGAPRWPARYAIRRAAWHALDHTWEIEDRS
ncbi:MAG: hypothetical protein ACYDAY_02225 [Candidatus Dormibacteria bacterium]